MFSSEIVGELQLKKFGSFLEEYASQLKDIEDALGESVGDSWDMTLDPISLQVVLYEILTIYVQMDSSLWFDTIKLWMVHNCIIEPQHLIANNVAF